MISAALALLGALVYGGADFFGGLAAKRLRSIVVTCVAAVSGLVALAIAQSLLGGVWTMTDALWGIAAGFVGVVAVALLYACLAIGPMTILSPLTAVMSAIAPMLWGLLVNGETLAPVGYVGLALALVAVVLVGLIPGERIVRPSVRGLVMAAGAGLSIGAFLIIVDQTSESSGLAPLVTGRATSAVVTAVIVGVLAVIAMRRGARDVWGGGAKTVARLSRRSAWWLAIACGVADAAANALLLVALRAGDLSIVSALTALYPSGTILLAAIVLRERVAGVQWLGLALALAAGGFLAVA